MIIDKTENFHRYFHLGDGFVKAFKFLSEADLLHLKTGKHEIESDKVYALVNEYHTKLLEESLLESHKRYADIQYLVRGKECIGYTPLFNQTPTKEYDPDADYMLFSEDVSLIVLIPDMFAVFFPEDLHMPGIQLGKEEFVRKIVVKVLL